MRRKTCGDSVAIVMLNTTAIQSGNFKWVRILKSTNGVTAMERIIIRLSSPAGWLATCGHIVANDRIALATRGWQSV